MHACIDCHAGVTLVMSGKLLTFFPSDYMNSLLLANYVVKCQVEGRVQVNTVKNNSGMQILLRSCHTKA
jgi:hypothetical protein